MKFLHLADLHLDSKFESLNQIDGLPAKRRLEQREALKETIEYIKANDIELLLIPGDLYEEKYIRRSSIEYLNKLFEEIPNVQVFIAPGNHDPYIKNSFYATFNWAPNVHIFKDKLERIDYKGIHIYGYGFTDFYCRESLFDNFKIEQPEDINILVLHGTLDAAKDQYNYRDYNPIKKADIQKFGFNYVALGHVHKPSYIDELNQTICYSGSCLSLGFDELGDHGVLVGNLEKDKLEIQFKVIDKRKFEEIEIDISEMASNEDIVDKIKELELIEEYLYKINLIGKRFFTINTSEIKKLANRENIIKIKDHTKIGIDIEILKQTNDIRGIFIRRLLERKEKENISEELLEKAIETGLEVLR